jgi:hypothetical protein
MKKRIAACVGWLLVAMASGGFVPQEDFSACRNELKGYVDELAKINAPTGKQVYHMRITVKTDMNAGSKMPDSETNVEVFMSAHQLHYVSDMLTTYQDEKDAFAVLPQRKMIVWSGGGKRPDAESKKALAAHIQDTLITVSKITKCAVVESQGRTHKQVTMIPYKKAIEAFRINRVEYFIDASQKRIEKVNTFYRPGEEIVMQSITYHELELNYVGTSLQKPVYEQIFNSSGKLLARYKGYQLIDNRK